MKAAHEPSWSVQSGVSQSSDQHGLAFSIYALLFSSLRIPLADLHRYGPRPTCYETAAAYQGTMTCS